MWRTDHDETFDCSQGVESRVCGVILAVIGRFPTSLDRVVAQLEQMVGGVPGVVSERPAIPRMVSLCQQRPVLSDANGAVDAGTGRAQSSLEDAEQTERARDHGCAGGVRTRGAIAASVRLGLPWGPVEGPRESDAHLYPPFAQLMTTVVAHWGFAKHFDA